MLKAWTYLDTPVLVTPVLDLLLFVFFNLLEAGLVPSIRSQ